MSEILTKPETQTPLTVLDEQVNSLESNIPMDTVEDQEGFARTAYEVADGVKMIFRGREDLPIIKHPDDESVTNDILTVTEPPIYTPLSRYKNWLKSDNVDENEDTFDKALNSGSENVEIIASTSPVGIVDAAIKLIELGHGNPENLEELQLLNEKIRLGKIDSDVQNLFDIIYVAGAIKTQKDELGPKLSSDGPMQAALALCGDQLATDVINTKFDLINESDQTKSINEAGEKIKKPGEQLSEVEMQKLKDAHFVAVHTTSTAPRRVSEAKRAIDSTSEYNLGSDKQFPRGSIHWSLNHAVESHMFGVFSDRPITVVEPLEDLIEQNGVPARIYGVDTYFDCNPGQPLLISERAAVIELHNDPDSPLINKIGNDIRIRSKNITSKDLIDMRTFLFGDDQEKADYFVLDMIAKSGLYKTESLIDRLENKEGQTESNEEKEYLKPYREMHKLVQKELKSESDSNDYQQALSTTFQKIINGDIDIAKHQDLHKPIVEACRLLTVEKLIKNFGGEVSQSNSQSQYMIDQNFTDKENEVSRAIGVETGLHDNSIEAYVEEIFSDTISRPLREGKIAGTNEFEWSAFDDQKLLAALSSAPWQIRRQIVRSGILNFTPKKIQKPSGIFGIPEY